MASDDRWTFLASLVRPQRHLDRFEKLRTPDWFGQVGVDSYFAASLGIATNACRSEHDQDGLRMIRVLLDCFGDAESVQFRHLRVEEDQRVSVLFPGHFFQGGECLRSPRRQSRSHPPTDKRFFEYAQVGCVIVHNQCRKILEHFNADGFVADGRVFLQSETHLKMERAAPARLAFQPDAATHYLYDSSANGETQTRAAKFASRGSVRLGENFKYGGMLFAGDANARIRHGKMQDDCFVHLSALFNNKDNFALRRKLHGIAKQIQHNLAQARGVTLQAV